MIRTYLKYGALLAALTLSTSAFAGQPVYSYGPPDPGHGPVVPDYGWNDDQQYGWGVPQPVYGWNDELGYAPRYPYAYSWNGGYDNGYRTYNGNPYNGDGETGQYLMQSGRYPAAAQLTQPNDTDELQPAPRVYHHRVIHNLQTGRAAYERPTNMPASPDER
jgi:hypothetical protein